MGTTTVRLLLPHRWLQQNCSELMMNLKLDWLSRQTSRSHPQKNQAFTGTRPDSSSPISPLLPSLFQKVITGTLKSVMHASFLSSLAIVLSSGGSPVSAAERLTIRLGPIEQSINVADLEEFAKTGQIPPALKPYTPLLTPAVQQMLSRRLQLDPNLADKFVDDLLSSSDGQQIIKNIGMALPNSTPEQLRAALALGIRQANGLSAISFLRAYPSENVTVDATSALGLALQFNVSYWQSQALGPLLERELATSDKGWKATFDPAALGLDDVQQETITLQDQQRNRTIPVDVYWTPTASGPLVVISHGFGADRTDLAYLARHLASHGLTVAALEHPGSDNAWVASIAMASKASDLISPSEFVDRPKDISFLLDELAKLNDQPGYLHGLFNTQQVTVIGHSLGGYTALAVAGAELNLADLRQFCKDRNPLAKAGADWLQCGAADLQGTSLQLRDRRVAEAIAFNPVVGHLFGKTGMSKVGIPTLLLTSTDDALAPSVSHQLQPFTHLAAPKYLITAIGATHLSVTDPKNLNPALAQSTLVKERTGKDVEPLRHLILGASLAFIKQLTPEAKAYEKFLTPAYAQSISTPSLPLRLNKDLPPSITTWLNIP